MQSFTVGVGSPSLSLLSRLTARTTLRFLLAGVLPILLTFTIASAQTVNLGDDVSRPMPGSGHDYIHALSETVSPSNGNVEIKITVPTAPGRGFTLPFAITYESGEVHRFTSGIAGCGGFDDKCTYNQTPTDRAEAGHGWSDTLPYTAISLQNQFLSAEPYYGAILWCPLSSSYNFYDADGGSHMLGLAAIGQGQPVQGTTTAAQGCTQVPYGSNGYYYTYSRTGGDDQVSAQMDATCDGNYMNRVYPVDCDDAAPAFTVTDVKGTTYSFPANAAEAPSSGSNTGPTGTGPAANAAVMANIFPSQVEDRNGNIFSFTPISNSFQYGLPVIDSLGRTHISATTGSNGYSSYTVDGLQYNLGYTTMNANYTVGYLQVAAEAGVPCNLTANVQNTSLPVIQTITLPNSQAYTFKYDPTYGLVNEIDYPDGGWVRYTWGLTQNYSTLATYDGKTTSGGVASGGCNVEYQTPAILTRTVGYTANGGAQQTQNFVYTTTWNSNGQWTAKTTTVTTKDVQMGTTATTTYQYTPVYQPIQPDAGGQLQAELPVESLITQTDWGSSATLSQTTKTWFDQFEMTGQTTLLNGMSALTSKKVFTYNGGYPQQLQSIAEYDFGQSSPTRQTNYSYYTFTPPCLMPSNPENTTPCQNWTSKSTGFAPTKIVTTDGQGNRLAETDAYYDGTTPTSSIVAPVSLNDVTGLAATIHDETNYAQSSTQARSNLTEVIKWSNVGGSPTTALSYDKTGQIRTKTDPCVVAGCSDMAGTTGSNYWAYSYADQWSSGTSPTPTNAYLTQVTDPLGHQTKYQYAWSDGQLTNVTDSNSKTTTYQYNDSLRRMTNIGFPDGGATKIIYNDSVPSIETDKLLNSSGTLVKSVDIYDGMGHVLNSSLTSDPFGPTSVTMTYNGMGKVFTKTNPERSTPSTSDGTSTYYYDALGRPVETIEQDHTSISTWCYDGVPSAPAVPNCAASSRLGNVATGAWVDSWDQVGNHLQHVSDSFGRLTEVMEPNGSTQTPTMETDYTYDLLNNLKSVTQWGGSSGSSGARTRSFNYDSLSRLSAATNPESGTVNYVYDLNGNLNYKTSPAVNVLSTAAPATQTISYCYDVLNRVSHRFYSGGVSCSAPANYVAAYSYDTATSGVNTVGRMTSATSYSGTTLVAQRIIPVYDAMGRLQNETQCTFVNCAGTRYAPSYTYDYLGNVLTAAPGLPSTVPVLGTTPLQITSQFDAAGRLEEVSSNVPDAANSNYPSTLFLAESTSPAAYGPVGLAFASIGIDQNTSLAAANTSRAYDNKARLVSENDASSATGNFGIIKITGAEQSTVTSGSSGTSGQAIIQVGGGGQPYTNSNANAYVYINGVLAYTTFPGSISTTYVAQQIANAINSTSGMPARAQADGPNVVIVANTVGTATNYSLSLTENGITYPLTVPSSLTGGTNSSPGGTVYDSGTVNATLGGVTASYAWGSTDTTTTISSGLASAMNTKFNGTLTGTPGDGIITLSGNFGITTSVTFNSATFAVASFVAPYQGSISYAFNIASSGGFDAAGNLKGVTDTVTGTWAYGYDTLNRLTKGVAATGSYKGQSGCWAYDGWSNRLAESYSTGACPSAETSLTPTAGYNTSNQLLWTAPNAGLSFTYDQAGNILYDGVNHYVYDADGRLCAVQALGGMTGYLYDAEGTRVTKGSLTSLSCNLATNGFIPNTNYELGLGGEQISELSVSGTSPNYVSTWTHSNIFAGGKLLATYRGTDTYFSFSDWLGTKRVEITPDKQESSTFSLAYGNQLSVSGNAADATEQHLTGKERDSESGLDYFEARYYGSSMGRFMSPDYSDMTFGPDPVPNADITNPQSLNLYAYGQNNPVKNIDPDGHDCINTSNYSTNGTVTITTGSSCASDPGKYGTYVDGTIDQNSITASSKPSGTTFGYNFTSYDGQSGGAGVITQAPAYGPLEGPANLAGAGLIGSQTKMIGAFAGASVVGGVLGAGGLAIAGADLSLTSIGAMTRFQATRAAWLALKGTGAAGLINQFFKTGVIPPGLTPAMMQTYLANAIAYVESGSFPPGGVATQTARIAQLTAALGK